MRQTLGQAARAHEDERRPMLADMLRETVVDLAPHLVARNRAEFVSRHFDRKLHLAPMTDIDDGSARTEEASNAFDRFDGRRQADALRLCAAAFSDESIEPCKR